MNLLDLGIFVLIGLVTVRGYYRGLFQELAVLAGLAGGVLVAANTYLFLAGHLQSWLKDPLHARIAAFALILIAVYWLTRLAAHFLQRLLYYLYLDIFDRFLGAFFAFVKAALLIGFALMLLGQFMPRDSNLLKESRATPHLVRLARQAMELLPADFKLKAAEYLRQWQRPKEKPKGDQALRRPSGGSA